MTLALLLACPIVIAVAIGVVAARTMPPTLARLRPSEAFGAFLLSAIVGVTLYLVLNQNRTYEVRILAVVIPSLLLGALLRRLWAAGVPAGLAVVVFSAAYLQNPSCDGCGELDWFSLIVGCSVFIVAPGVVAVLLGVALRNGLARLAGRQRVRPIAS